MLLSRRPFDLVEQPSMLTTEPFRVSTASVQLDGASVPTPRDTPRRPRASTQRRTAALRVPRAAVPRPGASLRMTTASLLVSRVPRRAATASVAPRGAFRHVRRDARRMGKDAAAIHDGCSTKIAGSCACERAEMPSKLLERPSPHLGRRCARVTERCSLPAMLRPFGAMPRPFPRMPGVFVGHSHVDSATPSPLSEYRDALAAVPSGLREARRVLGAAPSASARVLDKTSIHRILTDIQYARVAGPQSVVGAVAARTVRDILNVRAGRQAR